MRVDLDQVLVALDGTPFTTGEVKMVDVLDDDGNPVLDDEGNPQKRAEELKMTARHALVSAFTQNDPKADLMEKVSRGVTAQRLYEAEGHVDLTADEVVKAKDLVGRVITNPVAMMRMIELLDPTAVTKERAKSVAAPVEDKAPEA